jgi:hypothetical protein
MNDDERAAEWQHFFMGDPEAFGSDEAMVRARRQLVWFLQERAMDEEESPEGQAHARRLLEGLDRGDPGVIAELREYAKIVRGMADDEWAGKKPPGSGPERN